MGILIPLTPRLRAFGKSRTDFTDVTIYNVLKDVIKELPEIQRLILDDVIKDTTITASQLEKMQCYKTYYNERYRRSSESGDTAQRRQPCLEAHWMKFA
ncbi:MAG: hypothetical protein KBS95_05740 [Alistipes sp.]|nr:hypothetical protein [Candidatus Alistipes equi]